MADEIEQILRRTASLVNVKEGMAVPDPVLLIFVQGAHDTVVKKLNERGTSDLRYRVEITVPSSTTGTPIAPTLPSNIITPLQLWERNGTDTDWKLMRSIDGIPPNLQPSDRITYWDWRNQQLWLPECQNTTTVRIDYLGGPIDVGMPHDNLELVGLVEPISWQAAADACFALEDNRSQMFASKATELIDLVANLNTHTQQTKPVSRMRRRPGLFR